MRWELREPEVIERIVQLKTRGDSFTTITKKIQDEFKFTFKVTKGAIYNAYNDEMKKIMAGDKTALMQSKNSPAMEERKEAMAHIKNQLYNIGKILWKHMAKFERVSDTLEVAVKKWEEQVKNTEKPNQRILNELRTTISHDVAAVTALTSQLHKQHEIYARLIGAINQPATVHVDRLSVINQINQNYKELGKQGYYLIKPNESDREFNLHFENQSGRYIFNELVRIGLLKKFDLK